MEIAIETHDHLAILRPRESCLDTTNACDLSAALMSSADRGARRIILDLADVAFVDSTGLGAIVSGLRQLTERGAIRLCGLHPAVRTVFEVTHLDRVFPISDSVLAAQQEIAN